MKGEVKRVKIILKGLQLLCLIFFSNKHITDKIMLDGLQLCVGFFGNHGGLYGKTFTNVSFVFEIHIFCCQNA